MKVRLDKIPSIVKNISLSCQVEVVERIKAEEGSVLVVEALEHEGRNNVLDFASGRLGRLVKGNLIPAVLGKRRALREYSGNIPRVVKSGNKLSLLCESGLIGEIKGLNKSWGVPMKVKVIGSLLEKGKHANIKNYSIEWTRVLKKSAPIVAVAGTCMDSGKTTMICKMAQHFKARGIKVGGAKLTGVAFTQDLFKMKDAGIDPVVDFVDAGLPSTCGKPEEAVGAALGIINRVNKDLPDIIFAEFGDGIIGEYNVATLLKNKQLKKYIEFMIVAANDFVATWGAKLLMEHLDLPIDIITGPVVNNASGIEFVEDDLTLAAESNLHDIPKTIKSVERKIFQGKI